MPTRAPMNEDQIAAFHAQMSKCAGDTLSDVAKSVLADSMKRDNDIQEAIDNIVEALEGDDLHAANVTVQYLQDLGIIATISDGHVTWEEKPSEPAPKKKSSKKKAKKKS